MDSKAEGVPPTDSNIWGDLGRNFHALSASPNVSLSATWTSTSHGTEWSLAGDEYTQEQFLVLATQAGARCDPDQGSSDSPVPSLKWLNEVKDVIRESDVVTMQPLCRCIKDICKASAVLCARLQRKALETEQKTSSSSNTVSPQPVRTSLSGAGRLPDGGAIRLDLPDRQAVPDSVKPLVRGYLESARSKVRVVAQSLVSGSQTLEQAAANLELEAKIWGQNLHHAILDNTALEGIPPEQFEKHAAESAREIVALAANEFSVMCGRDTTDGVTPMLIGHISAAITSDQPPRINTRGSIIQYLEQALADYPQQYRRQNLSVYKLTHGAESVHVPILANQSGEQQAPSATRQLPDLVATPASIQTRVPLDAELKEAESRTADPKLRNKLVAVVRYNHYLNDLKVLKTACKQYQTPALLQQSFPDLDVWAVLGKDDQPEVAAGDYDPGRFAWSLVKRLNGLRGKDDRTLKNYRKALRRAGILV